MVSLKAVRESNAKLKATCAEQVALFVGATSGIARQALTEYARHSARPKIYVVGRNDAALAQLVEELAQINADGSYMPIKAEIALLKNVDGVCEQVKAKETQLHLLLMAPGYLKYKRVDNAEGLEDTVALRYYARMRFIYNLLPLLSASPSRVVSIMGAGKEGQLDETDLELKHTFSFLRGTVHTNTMNTLALQHLASLHPSISFVHVFPGLVMTGAHAVTAKDWVFPFRFLFLHVVLPLSRPVMMDLGECGERQLFAATSARYPPSTARDPPAGGVALPAGVTMASGPDKKEGSGCYLVDENGETVVNEKLIEDYRKRGTGKKVWEHTLEVFERVLGKA
ncbi:MAG: hypothetical protein M1838_003514 [Thelocarpon superellum]|nr:MAG: hypothetical protein M1838_003514 [Thelocarpon superellum]